jgi:hypothetical protein
VTQQESNLNDPIKETDEKEWFIMLKNMSNIAEVDLIPNDQE